MRDWLYWCVCVCARMSSLFCINQTEHLLHTHLSRPLWSHWRVKIDLGRWRLSAFSGAESPQPLPPYSRRWGQHGAVQGADLQPSLNGQIIAGKRTERRFAYSIRVEGGRCLLVALCSLRSPPRRSTQRWSNTQGEAEMNVAGIWAEWAVSVVIPTSIFLFCGAAEKWGRTGFGFGSWFSDHFN